jgi:hypothetical protein
MAIQTLNSKQHYFKINPIYTYLLLFTFVILLSSIKSQDSQNSTLNTTEIITVNRTVDVNIDKYSEFNLTQEIEKQYDEYAEDKSQDYYKNADQVDEGKKKKKKQKETQDEIEIREWEEKIQKFTPEELMTVMVGKKDHEVLFHDVTVVPTKIIVAYYVHDEEGKIDFLIENEQRKTIKKIKGKNRGFYEFNATTPGTYEFLLDNERVRKF